MKNKILALLIILLPAIRSLAAETITPHDISTGPLSITKGGTYTVTGDNNNLDANFIKIDVEGEETVKLTLKDIDLETENTHPIEILKGKVELTLEERNYLRNYSKTVVQVSAGGSLTIDGPGYLDVYGGYDQPAFGDEANPSTETAITILGGTIHLQSGKSAPLSITGGSVQGNFTEKSGKCPTILTLINQNGAQIDKNIATLTQPEGYGYLGARTDSYGRLYLWLPKGEQTVSLTLEGDERVYTGSVNATENYDEFTISPEGSHKVSCSSRFNYDFEGFPAYVVKGEKFTFSIKPIKVTSVTAENVDIRPTGNPDEYSFTMPDRDVELQVNGTDLKVTTDVEDGIEELTAQNELLIKKGGAYTITRYKDNAITPIRIADDVTGDVTLTLKDLSISTNGTPAIDCGKGSHQTTLILEGENNLTSYATPSAPMIKKGSDGTLKIEGTGTLQLGYYHEYMIGNPEGQTGGITINGGSITTNNTVFGQGNDISITGGSIKAEGNSGLLTSIGLTDSKHLVVVEGCDPKSVISDFSYGETAYNLKGMSPDKNGKLYLWLPAGEQTLTLVTKGNITYTGTVTVAASTANTCTLKPEEGVHTITLGGEDEDLTDCVEIVSLGKPGETIVFTAASEGDASELDRDFLFEFDTTPADLEITRSAENPDCYSFTMPDADVTLTPRVVAYDVETEQTDGYRYIPSEGYYLVITHPGTYTISNKEGLPVSGVPIWIANPDLFQGEEPEELEPIGPVTIILDSVNISLDKSIAIYNLSSTEVNIRSAEGSVNKLYNLGSTVIATETGKLTIGGPGKLILEGDGQADLICATARASVTFDDAWLETSNLDKNELNEGKYGISTQKIEGWWEEDYLPYPLSITGGTLTADYIGTPEEADPKAPVTISGGSIRCEELRGAVGPEGETLLRTIVTLPAGNTGGEETLVASYSGLGGYRLDNTYADSEGRLYLWLPEGATYPDVHINNGVGSVIAGQEVTLSPEEITPEIPDITYYTVTLPALEGASTQPGAGSYTVEEGTDFSFTLTLAEGYGQSVPIVSLSDGRTLAPDSRNQYFISYIISDLTVSITGIRPDIPTGIASAESDGITIEAGTGCLRIRTPRPVSLQIVRTDGEPSIVRVPAGDTLINGLPSGIYFVRPDGQRKARKLIVH